MGIDPGTNLMGYGVLRVEGQRAEAVALGVIDLRKYADGYLKLGHIYERVSGIIASYLPDELAIEAPFFGKNVQSMAAQVVHGLSGLALPGEDDFIGFPYSFDVVCQFGRRSQALQGVNDGVRVSGLVVYDGDVHGLRVFNAFPNTVCGRCTAAVPPRSA